MQNIGLYSQLGKEIDNFFKPFNDLVTKPQSRNLREMARGLIEEDSGHLLRIGEKVAKGITPRKNTERYSNMLQKLDHHSLQLQQILNTRQHFCAERKTGAPLLIIPDGGDIQKPHAQKMENICSTVDGSNGHKTGKGFPIISLMAYGTRSKEKRVLVTDLYSTRSEAFTSSWTKQKQWMEALSPITSTLNTIIVEDAIADDNKRLNYYHNDMGSDFLIRLTTKRNFLIKRHSEDTVYESISVKDLAQQMKPKLSDPREYRNKKLNRKLTSRIAYQPVEHSGIVDREEKRIPLNLIVIFTDGFTNPMLLLTNRNLAHTAEAWKHFFWYKRRWEIEKYYREIKQLFGVEKVLLQKYEALKAFLVVVMLVYTLLKRLTRKIHQFLQNLKQIYYDFLKQFQRDEREQDKPTVSTLCAFIRETLNQYQPLFTYHSYRWKIFLVRYRTNPNQLLLLDFRKKW